MDEGWSRFGRLVREEMESKDPPWTADRIKKLTAAADPNGKGVAPKTLNAWIGGQAIKRTERAYLLCDVLEWAHESVRAILAGGEPIRIERVPEESPRLPGQIIEQMGNLAASIEHSAATIREMLAQVDGSQQ